MVLAEISKEEQLAPPSNRNLKEAFLYRDVRLQNINNRNFYSKFRFC